MKLNSIKTARDLHSLIEAGQLFLELSDGDSLRFKKKVENAISDRNTRKKFCWAVYHAGKLLRELASMPCAVSLAEIAEAGPEG
jgi:hypothetical protein